MFLEAVIEKKASRLKTGLDYFPFGGQLPGRIWQQSGGEYRYGYQGQEKSMDETNWDNFELRNFNHDLGRWSAPDPYAQFHSPYLAMANNPVNNIDPNGGYMVASDEGMAQRGKFVQKWQEYVISDAGQRFIRSNYQRDYEELARKILTGYTDELMGLAQKDGGRFLEALLQLNNDYLGMGLSAIYLNSGTDRVVGGAILKNKKLVEKLQGMNGEAQRVADMQNVVNQYHQPIDIVDAAEQDFINENNRRQREYVSNWREEKWAKIDAADAAKAAKEKAEREAEKFNQTNGIIMAAMNGNLVLPGFAGGASVAGTSTINPGATMARAGAVALTASEADGPLPVGDAIGAATIVGTAVILTAVDWKTSLSMVSFMHTGSSYTYFQIYAHLFAQHGKNNGRLQEDERIAIGERIAAGTASSADWQKWKKDQKNRGERQSRQSKDKK